MIVIEIRDYRVGNNKKRHFIVILILAHIMIFEVDIWLLATTIVKDQLFKVSIISKSHTYTTLIATILKDSNYY